MRTVRFEDLEATTIGDASLRHELTEALGAEHLALNRYRLAPGGSLPGGLHTHMDQEEVFVVLEGTALFETLDGDVVVEAGEAVRFAPGDFQSGRNPTDAWTTLIAIGAPRDTEDMRIPVGCTACGNDDVRLDTADELAFVCPSCGARDRPAPCPECGGSDLRLSTGDRRTVVAVCRTCGATFDRPPLED